MPRASSQGPKVDGISCRSSSMKMRMFHGLDFKGREKEIPG